MRTMVIKLDDIGRASNRPVYDLVLWALERRITLSVGFLGHDMSSIPGVLLDGLKLGVSSGLVEVWNHGHRHIYYDRVTPEAIRDDVVAGHDTITEYLGAEPVGFGFPFNKGSEAAVALIRGLYPQYFVYERDLSGYEYLTPEQNLFADGQPNEEAFAERLVRRGTLPPHLVIQAHPPRWTNSGLASFKRCILNLMEEHAYVDVSALDAVTLSRREHSKDAPRSALVKVALAQTAGSLSEIAPARWEQVRRLLHPFHPRNILDLGSSSGDWSLPFNMADDTVHLILNPSDPERAQRLRPAIARNAANSNVKVDPRDLLAQAEIRNLRVDLMVCADSMDGRRLLSFLRLARLTVAHDGRLLLVTCAADLHPPSTNSSERRGARSSFGSEDLLKIAYLFDFQLDTIFEPWGQATAASGGRLEGYLFKKNNSIRRTLLARPDWLAEGSRLLDHWFGDAALAMADLTVASPSPLPVATTALAEARAGTTLVTQ